MNKHYTVTQVFRTGEKKAGKWSTRGRKPLGYNIYIEGVLRVFIPRVGSKGGVADFVFYSSGNKLTKRIYL